MAVAPIVGLGLAAVSTVASIQQQSAAAKRQNDALEAAYADKKEALALAGEEMQFIKTQAARVRDQERLLINAQKDNALQDVVAQTLQAELQKVQTGVASAQIRSQAEQAANSLTITGKKESAQVAEANTQSSKQLRGIESKIPSAATATNAMNLSGQERAVAALEEARGEILAENANRTQIANFNQSEATKIADVQRAMGDITAGSIDAQQAIQDRLVAQQAPIADKITRLQAQRNRRASNAKYNSTAATANLQTMQAAMSQREAERQMNAQKVSSPGFLSYLNAAGGLFNQGMQMGLFTFNNRQTPTATQTNTPGTAVNFSFTQSPLLDMLTQQGTRTDVTGNIYG